MPSFGNVAAAYIACTLIPPRQQHQSDGAASSNGSFDAPARSDTGTATNGRRTRKEYSASAYSHRRATQLPKRPAHSLNEPLLGSSTAQEHVAAGGEVSTAAVAAVAAAAAASAQKGRRNSRQHFSVGSTASADDGLERSPGVSSDWEFAGMTEVSAICVCVVPM